MLLTISLLVEYIKLDTLVSSVVILLDNIFDVTRV